MGCEPWIGRWDVNRGSLEVSNDGTGGAVEAFESLAVADGKRYHL
ncbi:hypothetical protein [Natronobeatus ordinarius]|nr:hypothetical protein [Natronobeatus ordinarius]